MHARMCVCVCVCGGGGGTVCTFIIAAMAIGLWDCSVPFNYILLYNLALCCTWLLC